ncbi:MAG: PspA/IM30 family protein [Chloroflexi bacterium]|nr:PspA/IM30 family protein [Chloroflexota bacterium]
MMGSLLRRFSQISKGFLDNFMAPAEDPRQTFVNAADRQRGLLVKVQRALSDVGTTKHRLEHKMAEMQTRLPQLQEEARHSLIAGQESVARLALRRRQVTLFELGNLEQQIQHVAQEEQRLMLTEQRLSTQIESFYARQEIIEVRYGAAEARVRIQEAFSGVSEELLELDRTLKQAEDRSERMQAQAVAVERLVKDGILDEPPVQAITSSERQYAQLEIDTIVEQQLAALKREL